MGLLLKLMAITVLLLTAVSQEQKFVNKGLMWELYDETYQHFLKANKHVVLYFYDHQHEEDGENREHIKNTAHYTHMHNWGHMVKFAQIDAENEIQAVRAMGISDFPRLKYFRNGVQFGFNYPIDKKYLIPWLSKKVHRISMKVHSITHSLPMNDLAVYFISQEFTHEDKEIQNRLSRKFEDVNFFHSNHTHYVANWTNETSFAYLIYRKEGDNSNITLHNRRLRYEELEQLVLEGTTYPYRQFNHNQGREIFLNKKTSCFLFYQNPVEPRLEQFKEFASQHKFEMPFYLVDSNEEYNKVIHDLLGVKKHHDMMVKILEFKDDMYMKYRLKNFTMEKMIPFFESYKLGIAQPYFKSEKIPHSNHGLIKTMVARTVKSMIFDNPHHVLVSIDVDTNPASILHKIMEFVADGLEHAHQYNLTLATYNINKNENPLLKIKVYPELILYKAGHKDKPIYYAGSMERKRVVRWLERHLGMKIRYPGPDRVMTLDDSL